ncbi:TlpA family protein disulfide reductase [bacterium]|nr:MAG: TlpA family protein disulfide reductase [bacterium]
MTKNGTFMFKGRTNLPELSHIMVPTKTQPMATFFWIDRGATVLELDTVPYKNFRWSGIDVKAKIIQSGNANKVIDAADKYKKSVELSNIPKEEKGKLIKFMVDSLLVKYPNSMISLHMLWSNTQYYNHQQLQEIYASLDKSLSSHTRALEIKNRYLKRVDVEIGKKLPDFSQNDPFGKTVSLTDFKGKYILVDFWASWCIPCRNENPKVVDAYQKYKANGFEILAVSLDSSKEAWIKAIKDDGLTWYHVSDLGGWNSEVSTTFKIKSVPANFLIDKDGVVIAKNLKGDELTKKLAEIFSSK